MFGFKKRPSKYTEEWFLTLSDEELYAEREPIRQAYCQGNSAAENLLYLFNDEEARRLNEAHHKEHPDAKPRHREHGWYLLNDDD